MIAIRHQLRADQYVDFAPLHRIDQRARLCGTANRVRCCKQYPRLREEFGDLLRNALHAWAAGHQRIRLPAFGAGIGGGFAEAAMVTH